ncbi:hypothetical protein [Senegalia massiliensis]|uniref:Uncharacterized protein n=1 Tax=Senegalia massiliensis TaxID=1720316 RepID=A0A845QVN5_9CLOT|nr:hypothetical protein [Senegalia massiliensis]NBI06301.1 hypothetical protein [Senegalia massiliensis]
MIRHVVKEVKHRDYRPVWQTSIIVMIGIIFINFLITQSNKLQRIYAYIVSISILIVSLVVFVYFSYRHLINYIYILDENVLIFKKGIREEEKAKLIVKQDEIQWIKPFCEAERCIRVKQTYKFIFKKDKSKMYVGQFIRNNKKYRFLFEPGTKMKKALNLEPAHN